MLDELIDRFGSGAVVTASPRMLDSGENYRWELMIEASLLRTSTRTSAEFAGARRRGYC